MADKTGTVNRYREFVRTIGKSALSAIYPNDFEFYLCALELVEDNKTVDYFVFPIQPSSIQKSEPTRVNIKTSMSGITVLKNSSVIPQEIVLKGNFGRNFKILSMQGVAFSNTLTIESGLSLNTPSFSVGIKTGYGAIKILQKIIKKSNELDASGNLRKLYFYNMALGENYLVTSSPSGNVFSQTQDMNMIWQYSVNLSVLAPLSEVSNIKASQSSGSKILGKNIIQKTSNIVAQEVTSFLTRNNGVTRIAAI